MPVAKGKSRRRKGAACINVNSGAYFHNRLLQLICTIGLLFPPKANEVFPIDAQGFFGVCGPVYLQAEPLPLVVFPGE